MTLDFRDTVRPNYLRHTAAHTDHSKTLARTSRTSGAVQLSHRLAGCMPIVTEEQRLIEEAAKKRRAGVECCRNVLLRLLAVRTLSFGEKAQTR